MRVRVGVGQHQPYPFGDGLADLLVGAGQDRGTVGVIRPGEAYVIYGRTGGSPIWTSALGTNGFAIKGNTGGSVGDNFSWSNDSLGDLNGDGLNDLGFYATATGKAYVM